MQSAYKDASKQEADEKKRDVKDTQCKWCTMGLISALAISVVINVVLTSIYFSAKEDRGAQYFCPDNWIGFQDKCYYFSEEEKDWNSSRYDCLSQNASLVMIATTKEKHFLKRFKCTSDHWIWRDMTEDLTGQWVDENIHDKGTNMKGNEICFYLNEDGVATARCYTERKWICRKKVH
ncbi:C-type lectin domain family 2 member B-like isoform X1 [Bos javanicus]|uniref:C-type lectin domain family 2 member B-like isoform X1 n=2 Tax=Bos javanicus TaxID=9906 RepID=UPI002AA747D8|nr:C-type lectin domain family 2 member B-like isoform X1 [Bos javanicus]XP_061273910.1 C-type lectin domain family 2 member B-like isoform X1 [Bos javanicus]XP_061273911.1 C-type lectin domain family 2 member B-like isoform X1 [Bos javanicus]XP_061273912.1 C-type lectin domain family 2 member B-like isoform X1 [Bos javanicus]